MGRPIPSVATEIFLNSLETAAMTDCPIHFKLKIL